MARRRVNTTRLEIIQVATEMILNEGYSATTPKRICDELGISTGNLTYYFPTKEHLLAVLVDMLCDFQRHTIQHMTSEGATSLLAVCMELAIMASMAEDSEIAKDLFISAYSSPMSLEIIRKNDTQRAISVYAEFCPDWTHEQFIEAENLVSGIEFATMMTTGDPTPLEIRITGALNNIMKIFNMPEDIRRVKIQKVLSMDYRSLGKQVLAEFCDYVKHTNEQTLEAVLRH